MATSAWLTWKMHRFEVFAVVVLVGLLAVSAWIVASHMTGLGLSDVCWPRDEDGNYATAGCDSLMNSFYGIVSAEGSFVRIGLAVVAPITGLIIGVPVVARELEMRTTAFAWSLQTVRERWLVARAMPMLLVVVAGLVVLGIVGTMFFDGIWSGRQTAALTEVGSQGLALVARGVLAFGIALLVGALVGRTMPAFILAGIAVVLWFVLGVGFIQGQLSAQWAVWEPNDDSSWRAGAPGPIAYLDAYGMFDTTKPGVNGEPGARIYEGEIDAQVQAECGEAPIDDTGESPATIAWGTCADPIYQRGNDSSWSMVVPASRYGDFAAMDVVANLLVGGLAILLAFPVVMRRRPS